VTGPAVATRYLGTRRSPLAKISNDDTNPWGNGFWVIEYTPYEINVGSGACEMYHLTVKGPTGSQLQVYVNQTFWEITNRGDINSWDSSNALYIPGGQSLLMYWDSAATPAPTATIWLRVPV